MHNLILKIFLAYWFAAALVIFIPDFGPHLPRHNRELANALKDSLETNGSLLIDAYESSDCTSVLAMLRGTKNRLYLATSDGHVVCGDRQLPGLHKMIDTAVASHELAIRDVGLSRFSALAVRGSDGRGYVLLSERPLPGINQASERLPGLTSVEISGVVTLLLAMLVVYPIRRLRAATQRIAAGDLETRLKPGRLSRLAMRLKLRDDLDWLLGDFNAMAQRLQSLVTAQRLLMRDVSHELRSPLARLSLASALLRQSGPDEFPMYLDRIERESIRLNGLIEQILEFSYIEGASESRHKSGLSLERLVNDLLPDVEFEANSRRCRILKKFIRDAAIDGDSDMLRHALENIVRNAIRHSPQDAVIEIHVDIVEHEGRMMAVLRVVDAGPGVSEDKLKLILNPFYRIEQSRHGITSGFGVGLAIADRAVQLHEGRIVASNRKGGGLIVEMFLPLPARAF
jgi:two-component system sensor histidine kinase CpxA